ncbi:MAG: ribonuclease HII [bacterium]|nr:ribonuclease HII [bacterium]
MIHYEYENNCLKQGYKFIAGIDEVGRGPLAGPVVAGAVILPGYISQIDDSKKLLPTKRANLAKIIKAGAVDYGIGSASVEEIDQMGLQQASYLAFRRAIEKLKKVDYLLIDGLKWKDAPLSSLAIINGDAISCSVAAASIIAKVYRDNLMCELHKKMPDYRFDLHKGYGTKLHLELLERFGISEHHRKSFAPIKRFLNI